jgi:hypothetical protein
VQLHAASDTVTVSADRDVTRVELGLHERFIIFLLLLLRDQVTSSRNHRKGWRLYHDSTPIPFARSLCSGASIVRDAFVLLFRCAGPAGEMSRRIIRPQPSESSASTATFVSTSAQPDPVLYHQ